MALKVRAIYRQQCKSLCIKNDRIFSISPPVPGTNGQNDRDTIFHLLLEFPGFDEYFDFLLHGDQENRPGMMERSDMKST